LGPVHIPVVTVDEDTPLLQATGSKSAKTPTKATRLFKYFPRFAFLKLRLAIVFDYSVSTTQRKPMVSDLSRLGDINR
jgi:hypothetical protein